MDKYKEIRDRIPPEELLAQLAEEASELSQAALKMRRTLVKGNPTPVTMEQAEANLMEEIADVTLCIRVAGLDRKSAVDKIANEKAIRWIVRLMREEIGG